MVAMQFRCGSDLLRSGASRFSDSLSAIYCTVTLAGLDSALSTPLEFTEVTT